MVGARGFEPPTPGPPDRCANRTALRSVARHFDGYCRGRQVLSRTLPWENNTFLFRSGACGLGALTGFSRFLLPVGFLRFFCLSGFVRFGGLGCFACLMCAVRLGGRLRRAHRLRKRRINAVFHNVASLENDDAPRRDRHDLAGLRVSAYTFRLFTKSKGTE